MKIVWVVLILAVLAALIFGVVEAAHILSAGCVGSGPCN
jgi:hypothetical protein